LTVDEKVLQLIEGTKQVEEKIAPLMLESDLPQVATQATLKAFSLERVALAWATVEGFMLASVTGSPAPLLEAGALLPLSDILPAAPVPLDSDIPLPCASPSAGATEDEAGYAFPLFVGDRLLGLLLLWADQEAFFSPVALAHLQAVARKMAYAAHNARLYTAAQQVNKVHLLTEAVGELTHSLRLQDTLQAMLKSVQRLVGAEAVDVTLFQPHTGKVEQTLSLVGQKWVESGQEPRIYALKQDTVSNLRAALRLPDLQSLPVIVNSQQEQGLPYRSTVAIPLRIRDKLIGLLAVASSEPQAFDLHARRLLQLLASQAAFAIRNAQLYEESQRHLREIRALFSIGQSIVSTLDLDEVLNLVAKLAIKTIPNATKCVIHLPDLTGAELLPTAVASRTSCSINRQAIPFGAGVAGHAMAKRETIYVPDCREDPRYLDLGTPIRSLLSAPLLSSDRTAIGVISVDSGEPASFSADDKRLLTTFALQAAIAIENAQLFRSLQDTYRDLAEKQTEILQSKNTMQALFNGITDGISIIDRKYTLVAINQAEAKLVGRVPSEITGRRCYEVFWDRKAPCSGCPAIETLATGHPATAMQRVSHEGRNLRTFEVQTYPLFDENERVEQVIFLARDVTNRNEMEASLAKSATLAAVGQLAAGLAHEINNPLTVILGNGQMLLEDTSPLHPDYPLLEMIVRAGERARQVISRLLEFSAQEGQMFGTVDLNETIVSAVALIAHTLRKNGVHINTQLQAGLPHLAGFVGHLQTVWMNLILNAIDAVNKDEYSKTITISSCQRDEEHLQVQVIDHGCGISAQSMKHLFEPFYSTKAPGKGAGLGLYTCYHVVRRHRGTIDIQSKQGQGTTVTVILPLDGALDEALEEDSSYRSFEVVMSTTNRNGIGDEKEA